FFFCCFLGCVVLGCWCGWGFWWWGGLWCGCGLCWWWGGLCGWCWGCACWFGGRGVGVCWVGGGVCGGWVGVGVGVVGGWRGGGVVGGVGCCVCFVVGLFWGFGVFVGCVGVFVCFESAWYLVWCDRRLAGGVCDRHRADHDLPG
ncbi:hypothetical protein RA272_27980, partial [Pseudomonas syringae pv. tagetis]|uniref:hypothetical protein n=1 Tax=Pseudomonas syringae group genomosp. 7 TaxID=251699 RepID=UPI00376F79E4